MNDGKKNAKHTFDFRWIIVIICLIVLVIIAVFVNLNRIDNGVSKIASMMDVDNGDLKINWDRYKTIDIDLGDTFTVSESGTYHLTGKISDGQVVIDVGVGEVRLILDNVSIKNSNGPAIYCKSAEDLVIELSGDNVLSDGNSYASSYDKDVDGAIYSKSDLAFSGDGKLTIVANYKDAIVGKDDVKFNGGNYAISSLEDGIRGKDSVYIVGGSFNITSGADAIKSTNEIDTGKGFILIEDGDFSIVSGDKGLNSVRSLLLYGGNFLINSHDDAIHSDTYIGFNGGNFEISSGDDGIHADRELIVDNGEINILKSYEGFEAQVITINGGNISTISSDDGLNAGGGADSSSKNRPGMGTFDSDVDCVIDINGGNIYINSSGDGIDSNGYIYFNGGTVHVDGPTNNGNGALDSGAGITMSGGEVIAVGASGMAEDLGSSSSVFSISIYFASNQSAGTEIGIVDSEGNTIINYIPSKTFAHLAFGNNQLKMGEAYSIYLNGDKYLDFTVSNIVTTVGNMGMNHNIAPGGPGRR